MEQWEPSLGWIGLKRKWQVRTWKHGIYTTQEERERRDKSNWKMFVQGLVWFGFILS